LPSGKCSILIKGFGAFGIEHMRNLSNLPQITDPTFTIVLRKGVVCLPRLMMYGLQRNLTRFGWMSMPVPLLSTIKLLTIMMKNWSLEQQSGNHNFLTSDLVYYFWQRRRLHVRWAHERIDESEFDLVLDCIPKKTGPVEPVMSSTYDGIQHYHISHTTPYSPFILHLPMPVILFSPQQNAELFAYALTQSPSWQYEYEQMVRDVHEVLYGSREVAHFSHPYAYGLMAKRRARCIIDFLLAMRRFLYPRKCLLSCVVSPLGLCGVLSPCFPIFMLALYALLNAKASGDWPDMVASTIQYDPSINLSDDISTIVEYEWLPVVRRLGPADYPVSLPKDVRKKLGI